MSIFKNFSFVGTAFVFWAFSLFASYPKFPNLNEAQSFIAPSKKTEINNNFEKVKNQFFGVDKQTNLVGWEKKCFIEKKDDFENRNPVETYKLDPNKGVPGDLSFAYIEKTASYLQNSRPHKLTYTIEENFNTKTQHNNNKVKRDFLGLSIDGGGMRNYLSALYLKRLEDWVIDTFGTKTQLYNVYDCIGGASFGGLLALGLSNGIKTDELVKIFEIKNQRIFPQNNSAWHIPVLPKELSLFNVVSKRYGHQSFEHLLKEILEDKNLQNAKTGVLVTGAVSLKTPIIFSNTNKFKDIKMWEAARITASIPTYFKGHNLKFDDEAHIFTGSDLVINDPSTLVAKYLMTNYNIPSSQLNILSIGTGDYIPPKQNKKPKLITFEEVLNTFQKNAYTTTNSIAMDIFFQKGKYKRFNPILKHSINLDNTSEKAISAMKQWAQSGAESVETYFKKTKELMRKKLESKRTPSNTSKNLMKVEEKVNNSDDFNSNI